MRLINLKQLRKIIIIIIIMANEKQNFKDKITETLTFLRDDEAVENFIKSKVPVRKRKF